MLQRAAHGARSSLDVARLPLLVTQQSCSSATAVRTIHGARWASTAQQRQRNAFKPATSPQSSSPVPSSSLNPPTSTLPPPLETPNRTPEQSQFSYLFSLGKAYLGFYKTGLKAVWSNGKDAVEVRRTKLGNLTPAAGAESGAITRGEWLLLRRSAADRRRIPMFALLFALCGEFTPLVVVFASPLVPWTCRIPRQVTHERQKQQERRRLSVFDVGRERLVAGGSEVGWEVNRLRREQVLHIGRALALYGRTWDLLGGFPLLVLRRRILRRFEHLRLDDRLIRAGGGPQSLSDEEVGVACEDRGIDVVDENGKQRDPDVLRKVLDGWLEETQRKSMAEVVLVQ